MPKLIVHDKTPTRALDERDDIRELVEEFAAVFEPLEKPLYAVADGKTEAIYVECHIKASRLFQYGTIDVALDPDEQPEYRANRDIVEDNIAYQAMCDDAREGRTFSNIVTEFGLGTDDLPSLMIVGGQHRYEAIRQGLEDGWDQWHGVKVYFGLDTEQRLDVQLISNTRLCLKT